MEFTMAFFNAIMEILNTVLNYIFVFLPESPFKDIIKEVESIPFLPYVNYFIPIDKLLAMTSIWLGAIVVFYVYQIILRWIKAIGD